MPIQLFVVSPFGLVIFDKILLFWSLFQECDCGKTSDPCCDCSTCTLKANSACSSADACCDATTCSIKSAGTVCRAAASDCDIAEVCTGSSAICPSDVGKNWGTSCTASDGTPSTCYGKVCLPSLDEQCKDKTSGSKGVAKRNVSTGLAREFDEHSCTSPWCCTSCEQTLDWKIFLSRDVDMTCDLTSCPQLILGLSNCSVAVTLDHFSLSGFSLDWTSFDIDLLWFTCFNDMYILTILTW